MAQEFRKIILTGREVEAALAVYFDKAKGDIRAADIRQIELDDGPEVGGVIQLNRALFNGRSTVPLGSDQIGAAMILYCREKKIPLPRRGTKSLEREFDGVALTIRIDRE